MLLLGVLIGPGCGPSDPHLKILQERARWEVRILSWAQGEQGVINVSTQVSGPPNSNLKQLTVRFDLIGEGEERVGAHWHTYDLAQVPRGGPSDLLVGIPAPGPPVEGLAVSLVLQPTPEEKERIPELRR
jgi:hypothetical protein